MIYRELGDQRGIGIALLTCLGVVACEQGDDASSSALLGDSLEVWRELDDRRGIADCLEESAGLAFALRQFERGACLYGHASRLRNEMGAPLAACEQSDHDRRIASARGSFGNDAAFDWAWKEGYGMTPEEAIEYALQERAVIDDPRG
jgi:hypothetical protein